MSTARKYGLAPDEVFTQDALKDGRAVLQDSFSMKAIGRPPEWLQARVNHLEKDHVHRLDLIFRQQGRLAPIKIFQANRGRDVKVLLADGFHRHEVYRVARMDGIPAVVFDVPWDRIDHEARKFAAMCNQVTLLARTPQDVRKAVELLFSDPECWGSPDWDDKAVAVHCGCHPDTVKKYRMEYAVRNKLDLPRPRPLALGGKLDPREATAPASAAKHKLRPTFKPAPGPLAKLYPASTPTIVPGDEIEPPPDAGRPPLGNPRYFKDWLLRQGVLTESPQHSAGLLRISGGLLTSGRAIIVCPPGSSDDLYAAIGKAMVFRRHYAPEAVPTVVVGDDRPYGKICDLAAEGCGCEFLTAKELAADLEAAQDEGKGR